jgi:fatty-acid desaturase
LNTYFLLIAGTGTIYCMLCFHGYLLCNKIIVNFNFMALLLYILSTRVSEIHSHTFLIHAYSSHFIMRSFSLTVNNNKCILFVLIFGDDRHNTPHIVPSCSLLALFGCAKFIGRSYTLCLGMLRQWADRHMAKDSMPPMFERK